MSKLDQIKQIGETIAKFKGDSVHNPKELVRLSEVFEQGFGDVVERIEDISSSGSDRMEEIIDELVSRLDDSIKSYKFALNEIILKGSPKGEIREVIKSVNESSRNISQSLEGAMERLRATLKVSGSDSDTKVISKLEGLSKAVQSLRFPTDAKNPISVRLSDGEKFYDAITQVMGGFSAGGGGSVPKINISGTEYAVTTSGLSLPRFDYVSMSINSATETYTFKVGGASGNTVATVVIVYTDSTRVDISTVTKT